MIIIVINCIKFLIKYRVIVSDIKKETISHIFGRFYDTNKCWIFFRSRKCCMLWSDNWENLNKINTKL